jgi:hypothetical protein
MSGFYWHDWAGLLGVLLMLGAFALLQAHKLHGNGLTYQVMNIFGALGVLLSLTFGGHNWSAFVMEAAWLLISIYGVMRSLKLRREERGTDQPATP